MQVLQNEGAGKSSSEDIDQVVQENIDERSVAFSDQSTSYIDIAK